MIRPNSMMFLYLCHDFIGQTLQILPIQMSVTKLSCLEFCKISIRYTEAGSKLNLRTNAIPVLSKGPTFLQSTVHEVCEVLT